MQVLILTVGSRGDVQPYVALGRGLQQAGHHVTLATAATFAEFVNAYGLDFAPLSADYLKLLQTEAGKASLSGKGNRLKLLRMVQPMLRAQLDDAWRAAQARAFDVIVYHPKALGGYSIAEKLDAPAVLALPLPLYSPTRAFPSPILPFADLGPFNHASHKLAIWLATLSTRGILKRWRQEALGLPPMRNEMQQHGAPVLRLYAYSPVVVPTPADWDATSIATGYWFLPSEATWQPAPELVEFLAGGQPPIYVGFGSMPSEDAAAKTKLVIQALAMTGQRGVVATGWGGLASVHAPDTVFQLTSAPHDWLFPQMAAVVHHGGAGTTAAGLAAGVPTVVCPFFGDQPFWGRRVAELGAGPTPIPQRRLTAERLAAALQQVTTHPDMLTRAQQISAAICAEDGVGRAVALIEARVR
ncbi:MAG TPA: glycosyltransferase [Chloroflexi bacterium]|nr:glycosyltransferase [Chloroflexota bacterium]HHW85638.1 glycosyltransferase family 1 protein [Chloroflexota bacterium]